MIPMEAITSRKNKTVCHLRSLASDGAYRSSVGEYVCDGEKTLREALSNGIEPVCVLWKEQPARSIELPESVQQFTAPAELFEYASPLRSSGGPVFSVKIPERAEPERVERVIVLEGLQDPGNVGTVIRTANAFGMDAVVLVGACADLYNPKTVRATMGAIFRQCVIKTDNAGLSSLLERWRLPLYGAALSDRAEDLRGTELKRCAVAVGSEGSGLSRELLGLCDKEIIIPMRPCSESLNAAVAASVLMWEMTR